MRTLRGTAGLLALAACIACGDTSGPGGPEGAWALVSVNGAAIPAILRSPDVPGVDGYQSIYHSGSVEFAPGRQVTITTIFSREWPQYEYTQYEWVVRGDWTLRGTTFDILASYEATNGEVLPSPGGHRNRYIGVLDGDSLVMVLDGRMVYRPTR